MGSGDLKFYGSFVMRLKHQTALAGERGRMSKGRAELESIYTGKVYEDMGLLEEAPVRAVPETNAPGVNANEVIVIDTVLAGASE